MDSLQSKDESRVSLLSIPLSDLDASTPNDLLLLQLPPCLSVGALQSAVFTARPGQPASLVTSESSYALQRVETSNTLVMVAPPDDNENNNHRSQKRSKVTEAGKILTEVPARLLKTGGSGASFLELRKKKLRKVDLWNALKESVWNPFDDGPNPDENHPGILMPGIGRTAGEMAIDLQFSETEILQGLEDIQALAFPEPKPARYVLVAEEPMQECYNAILSTLAELAIDYAVERLPENFVTDAVVRLSENFYGSDVLIGHCINLLQNKKRSSDSAIYLDVTKVRAWYSNLMESPSKLW